MNTKHKLIIDTILKNFTNCVALYTFYDENKYLLDYGGYDTLTLRFYDDKLVIRATSGFHDDLAFWKHEEAHYKIYNQTTFAINTFTIDKLNNFLKRNSMSIGSRDWGTVDRRLIAESYVKYICKDGVEDMYIIVNGELERF